MTAVMEDQRWLEATAPTEGDCPLTAAGVRSWREAGYAFVAGVFPDELIDELMAEAAERFPAPRSEEAAGISDFGSNLHFPSTLAALNELTLHPRLLTAVATLLGVEVSGLRLSQSDLWPKYGRLEKSAGGLDNMDQRIHVDYPNHTLAHPTEWCRPEAVEMIVYLADVDRCGGPTAVVPRSGDTDPAYRWPIVDTPGVAELDYVNDRESAERYFARERPALTGWRSMLYERERYVRFRPGHVLFYRHDTWHRGTPMIPGTLRLVQNITFRRAECEWISTLHTGWAWSAYRRSKFLEKLIARASLDQRAVLGFPQPGSSYWTPATITAVEARHGVFGMDMSPYRAALEEVSDGNAG
jgi:ectoine hydroxylase-related dioxygenase (phytanoyl-CoA dioxygenase family)